MPFFVMKIIFLALTASSLLAVSPKMATPLKVVILLGAPGSGKGTQAVQLSQRLEIPHISTGDLLRENLKEKTPLGAKAKGYMESGTLVPDELVIGMLKERILREDAKKGYLLDGFPRTIEQAEALEKLLPATVSLSVLNLDVSDEVIIKRISGRLLCKEGHIQNLYFSPPKIAGKCDTCNSEFIQRSDDRPEIVTERLKVYHKQTAPLEDYYRKKGVLKNVNGERPPQEIFEELLNSM